MADTIQQADAAFDAWQTNYVTYFEANAAALGFDPVTDVMAINMAQSVWNDSYLAHRRAQADAKAAAVVKDTVRESLIAQIQGFTDLILANPAVSDEQKAGLGIAGPDATPAPVGAPTTRPVPEDDTGPD